MEGGHLGGEGRGGGGKAAEPLTLLLRTAAVDCGGPGERRRIVPGLGKERGRLFQLNAAVGQLSQRHLGGHGFPEDLCA